MKTVQSIAILTCVSMLAACTEPNGEPGRGIENGGALSKQDVGTATGVVAGGLVGSAFGAGTGQVLAVIGGGLLGGVLGNMIGKSLDDNDRAAYARASQRAMETGTTQSWHNEDTGNHGTVIPHRHYTNSDGQYCRDYTQTIYVDGERHKAHGTACKEADGTWRVVE